MKFRLLLFFLAFAGPLFSQLTLSVTGIPGNTPQDDDIYVAGSFQGWDPGNQDYILNDNGNGTYEITIDPPAGTITFKFTRGDWPSVEGNADGGFLPDREYSYDGNATTLELEILSWEDLGGGGGGGGGTATDNVYILDTDFYMPQLDRNRRIWIYLPPDYDNSSKYYPVMYMHDGQNVFDANTSFAGEWEVDESLNELFDQGDYGCIVVAVDNGGGLRADELSPWYNNSYNAGGEGGEYVNFIIETLKPHIDANYRTLTGRDYTAIMGSSLGGLISHYAIIEHQDVISKAGIFSPAYWFNPEIYDHSANTPKEEFMKLYMLAGEQEGQGSVVDNVNQMESTLLNNGFTGAELNKAFHTDGQHSEWYWAREFPWAYLWLFDGLDLTDASEVEASRIKLYPNPADTMLFLENLPELKRPVVRIYSLDGKQVERERLQGNSVDVSDLSPGMYLLEIRAKHKFRFTEKIIVN